MHQQLQIRTGPLPKSQSSLQQSASLLQRSPRQLNGRATGLQAKKLTEVVSQLSLRHGRTLYRVKVVKGRIFTQLSKAASLFSTSLLRPPLYSLWVPLHSLSTASPNSSLALRR